STRRQNPARRSASMSARAANLSIKTATSLGEPGRARFWSCHGSTWKMILKNIVSKRGLSLLPGHWPAEIHSDQLLLVFCFEIEPGRLHHIAPLYREVRRHWPNIIVQAVEPVFAAAVEVSGATPWLVAT